MVNDCSDIQGPLPLPQLGTPLIGHPSSIAHVGWTGVPFTTALWVRFDLCSVQPGSLPAVCPKSCLQKPSHLKVFFQRTQFKAWPCALELSCPLSPYTEFTICLPIQGTTGEEEAGLHNRNELVGAPYVYTKTKDFLHKHDWYWKTPRLSKERNSTERKGDE